MRPVQPLLLVNPDALFINDEARIRNTTSTTAADAPSLSEKKQNIDFKIGFELNSDLYDSLLDKFQ